MQSTNVLVSRICHDLITPFNAISLGLEAFSASGEKSLLLDIKKSVDNANCILKFIRELYSMKSDTFCYSIASLNQLTTDILKKSNISCVLMSDSDSVSCVFGKIILFNAIVVKEIMPFGGSVSEEIDSASGKIIATCSGQNVSIPDFNISELSHKNIIRAGLLKLLNESGFKIFTYEEESKIIIHEARDS